MSISTYCDSGYGWAFDGWSCLNRGDVVDPVILTNRKVRADGSTLPMAAKGMRGAGGAVSPARYQRLTYVTA
ncbi:MAG: hypothetical protein HOP35_15145 [Nitrospira sp.]|nr:hypothetical protein [Nitrospira sp.]